MKKLLFEDMIEKQKPTKKWLFLPISFVFHIFVITALVVAPLLDAEAQLPPIKTIEVMIISPNTLSMPVGRGNATRARGSVAEDTGGGRKNPGKPIRSNVLTEPVEIPDEIKEEDFIDFDSYFVDSSDHGDFVPGAPDGIPGAPPGDGPKKNTPLKLLKVEQIPKLIKKVSPVYPELALKARIQGTVVIEAETDIYGRVIKTQVISGPGILTDAALEAVKKWIYEPYIINGFPRPVRFSVTIEFTLKRH